MVIELVEQARRRFRWNQVVAQGAWALSAGTGALVLLLLLGTEVLNWFWLALLPLLTFGLGLWRVVRRMPSSYQVAQMVDSRLGLADTISTALYFDTRPEAAAPGTRAIQRAAAEQLCSQIDLRRAIPFTMPRAVYAASALLLAASSLFALRYAFERRLALEKPVAKILQHALGFERPNTAVAEEKKKKSPPKRSPMDEVAKLSLPASDQPVPGDQKAASTALDNSGKSSADAQKSLPQNNLQKLTAEDQESGEDSESAETAGLSTGKQDGSDGQKGSSLQEKGGKDAEKGSAPGASGNNSSLMAKFKDAMQNLLSRMKPQSGGAASAQSQSARNQSGEKGNPQPGANSQGGKQGKQAGQNGESQEGQPGQDAQMARNAQGRGTGQNGQEQQSHQPGSGIGRQDGNKDAKLAEQLAAMGKISEIIGKRSANLSGEVTVEVQSNSQQLQTPYAQRTAAHGESSAEINRDEVPVALQAYVQQYFEHVRKQSPPAKAKN